MVILEADTIKQLKMKEKLKKKQCLRKILKAKLCSKNLTKGINTWAVPLVSYSGQFLKWTRDGIK